MSTLKGSDPATDFLLDFIAEGESGGNYNAVIGDAKASDDLGAKSLAEIYTLMADLLTKGRPSTAVGRYQIIRSTLESLASKMSISPDTKFTPELQDRLGVQLMVGRGYSRWWTGGMTDEDFAHGLSMEWASLPDPENQGKSHYDGIGPNHASKTEAQVMTALSRTRALIGEPQKATSPDTSADDLNRQELERIRSGSVPPAPATSMAPGVGVMAGGLGISAVAGTIQFIWPLLHGQMPAAPTDVQATNLAGMAIAFGGGIQHLVQSWRQRKGN